MSCKTLFMASYAGPESLLLAWLPTTSQSQRTCEISEAVLIMVALDLRLPTTASTAALMPRLRSMGFMPAATDLQPSLKMARVRTVAVVVPAQLSHFSSLARSPANLASCLQELRALHAATMKQSCSKDGMRR